MTTGLRRLGWRVTAINDVYPHDAQQIADGEWMAYGFAQGWAALTKDKRIRRGPDYAGATGVIFALSNGNMSLTAMVALFDRHRHPIWRASGACSREFWMVYESEVHRQDP